MQQIKGLWFVDIIMNTADFPSFWETKGLDNLLVGRSDEPLYFGLFRLAYSAIDGATVLLINGGNDCGSEESVCLRINDQVYDMLTRCYKDMMLYAVSDVINDKSVNIASTEDISGVRCLVSIKVSPKEEIEGNQASFELSFDLGCRYQDGRSIFNSVIAIPNGKTLISQARDLFDKLTKVKGRGYLPINAFLEAQVEMFV